MFMRRVLALLCCFCIAFSAVCGIALGAGIDDIYGGNPWEDFEGLPGVDEVFPTNTPVISDDPELLEPVQVDQVGDGGISFSARAANSADTLSLTYSYQSTVTKAASGWSVLYGYTGNNMANYAVSYQYPSNTDSYSKSYSYTASVSSMKASTSVNYSADNFSKLNVTINTFRPRVRFVNGAHTTKNDSSYYGENYSLFAYVQFLVNGEPYGQKYSLSSYAYGNAITLNEEIELGNGLSTVTSLGLLWTFSSSSLNINGSGTITYSRTDGREWVRPRFDLYLVGIQSGGTSNLVVSTVSPGPGMDEETKGLLGTIIAWLTSIRDTIGSVFTAIIELPGKIATALIDGIKSLFIPDQDDFEELKGKYQTLLETKFGFIYQSFEMLGTLFDTVVSGWSNHSDYTFEFPGISFTMLGETYTIAEEQIIDMDNEAMTILRNFAGTIVSLICVLALVHSMETLFVAIVSGKNYFDFLAMQREAEAEVEGSQ